MSCRVLAALGPLFLSGCFIFTSVDVNLAPRLRRYVERTVVEAPGAEGKVALIEIEGVIADEAEGGLLQARDSLLVSVVEKLKKAEEDPAVKAVVLRVDSPGGGVTASDILYREIRAFKARKKVPVVVMLMDLAASGGYYVAVAGDRIVAHPTTVTGSIGVIALHVSLAGLLEKIGVRVETLKSGPLKDMVSPFRGLGDEERRVLQQLIDQMHERFVAVVAEGRAGLLTEAEVRRVADGRILSAPQALAARLVDRVGYLEQALEEARGMAGLRAAHVVMYSRDPQAAENVYSQPRASAEPAFGSLEWARGFLGVRLYYLWEPYLLGR